MLAVITASHVVATIDKYLVDGVRRTKRDGPNLDVAAIIDG